MNAPAKPSVDDGGETQAIRNAHDKCVNRAYELGRWAHGEGQSLQDNPFDGCDGVVGGWVDGWQDEKAGKP